MASDASEGVLVDGNRKKAGDLSETARGSN